MRISDQADIDTLEGLGQAPGFTLLYPQEGADVTHSGTKNPGFWMSVFSSSAYLPIKMTIQNTAASPISQISFIWTEKELDPSRGIVSQHNASSAIDVSIPQGQSQDVEARLTLTTPGDWWAMDMNLTIYVSISGMTPMAVWSGSFKVV